MNLVIGHRSKGFPLRKMALLFTLANCSVQAMQSDPALEVRLGLTVAQPGTQVSVPFILNSRTAVKVEKIFARLRFFRKDLTFLEAMAGFGAEVVHARVSTELKNAKSEGQQILEVTVAAKSPLPNSVLVDLLFEVSANVEAGEVAEVENLGVRAWTPTNQEIRSISRVNGEIRVVESLFMGCFFYMH